MHKQHPQTAYRKYAILIGTIFENCDKSSTIREAIKLLSSKGIVEGQQADEEAAPAHDPNPKKQQGPGAICSGACCHFLWKKIMLSGALRRLLFVHSLCGDYDNAHCYQIVFLIGYLAKRSAHVAGVCGLLAAQARKVVCTTLVS